MLTPPASPAPTTLCLPQVRSGSIGGLAGFHNNGRLQSWSGSPERQYGQAAVRAAACIAAAAAAAAYCSSCAHHLQATTIYHFASPLNMLTSLPTAKAAAYSAKAPVERCANPPHPHAELLQPAVRPQPADKRNQHGLRSAGEPVLQAACGVRCAVLRLAVAGLLCSVCDVALLCYLLLRGALHIAVRRHQPRRPEPPLLPGPLPASQSARSYGAAANTAQVQRTPSRTGGPGSAAAVPIHIPAGAYEEELEIAARTARSERGA